MYLSRLILNPRNRRVQKEIADPYQMHRSLMRAFPDDLAPDEERVLFRLESHPRTGALTLLVQSWNPPDWSWLEAPDTRGYLLPEHLLPLRAPENPATKPFDLNLASGQLLAFRLRANPTARRRLPDGTRKRVGLCREEEQMDWLERKAKQGGFRLVSAHTSNQAMIGGKIRRNGRPHKLRLLSVRYDGLLQVTDPERLHEAVRSGVGSGKAFGFGLLSLAPRPA